MEISKTIYESVVEPSYLKKRVDAKRSGHSSQKRRVVAS